VVDGNWTWGRNQKRCAIWVCPINNIGADVSARTCAVFYNDARRVSRTHFVSKDARQNVGRSTGWKRNNELDGSSGLLGDCTTGQAETDEQRKAATASENGFHFLSL
jgi:hypothetical protein